MLVVIVFLLFNGCVQTEVSSIKALDLRKTKVWGPGIQTPKAVMPARYFFIQAVDSKGYDIPTSTPDNYEISIQGSSRFGACRYQFDQIDRKDGSIIARYKMVDVCRNAEIHIKYRNEHVAKSPYKLGTIYSEDCNCPLDLDEYLEVNQCEPQKQIDEDLSPFRMVNFTNIRAKIIQKFDLPNSVSLCNYVVKNNEIFRQCFGQYTGFKMFMDAVLTSLVKKVKLPDTEFFINLGDWPLMKKGGHTRTTGPYPIFSWCGSEDTFDIVLPTYDITESTLQNMGRVMLDMLSVQRTRKPWNEKVDKAFFRGRDSRRERLDLMDIGRKNPEIYNVSMTNFFFFRDEEEKYGPKVAHISLMEFFDHKYQINMDGTVAAYRFPYLLAGSSLVLKQDSPFYEHFYKKLTPNHHYIPFKRDLSDLTDKVLWAMKNERKVLQIIKNAQQFTRENLLPKDIYCYHVLLLKKWSQNLVEVKIQPHMDRVPLPGSDSGSGPKFLCGKQFKNLIVHAVPGSGKTTTICHKIVEAILIRKLDPEEILLCSFTNRTVDVFTARLIEQLGNPIVKRMVIGTSHSICMGALRTHGGVLGYNPSFLSVIDVDMSQMIVNRLCENGGPSDVWNQINTAKRSGLSPDEYIGRKNVASIVDVYRRYEDFLMKENFIDFNGILMKTIQLLQAKRDIFKNLKVIVVDEIQDLSKLQHRMLEAILSNATQAHVTVVGDADQSIYSFLDVDATKFLGLQIKFDDVTIAVLMNNYRSTEYIMEAAQHVIKQDSNRLEKGFKCKRGVGLPIEIIECSNLKAEAETIVEEIVNRCSGSFHYKDCAILVRLNRYMDTFVVALKEASVPFRLCGYGQFFKLPEIAASLSAIMLAEQPTNEFRFRKLMQSIGIAPPKTDRNAGTNFIDFIQIDSLKGVVVNVRRLIQEKANPVDLVKASKIDSQLIRSRTQIQITRNMDRMASYAENFYCMSTFLDNCMLNTNDCVETVMSEKNVVILSTMHAAKAIKWPIVFVSHCSEKMMPHHHIPNVAMTPAKEYEECRILYVAMSWAKYMLTCTFVSGKLSRFFANMPRNLYVTASHSNEAVAMISDQTEATHNSIDLDSNSIAVVKVTTDLNRTMQHLLPPGCTLTIGRNVRNSLAVDLDSVARFGHVSIQNTSGLILLQPRQDTWVDNRAVAPGSSQRLSTSSVVRLAHQRKAANKTHLGATLAINLVEPVTRDCHDKDESHMRDEL